MSRRQSTGVAAWHRDVQLGPHLQSYEESLRWLGQLDGDTSAPKIDLTIGARHAALLATCQHWSKQLQKQWARCVELTCAVLDVMPPKSEPQRRLATLLDLLPFLLLRRDDGQSQKHMETSIRQRCTKFLGGDWQSLYRDLQNSVRQAVQRKEADTAAAAGAHIDQDTHDAHTHTHTHTHTRTTTTGREAGPRRAGR